MSEGTFTPALGRLAPVRFYDLVMKLSRESTWRGLVVERAALRPGEAAVDVGCGTGSQALLLHRSQPGARIIGVDPDPAVLAIAREKAEKAGAGDAIDWRGGFGEEAAEIAGPGTADVAVSSLVLHQCPIETKRSLLAAMHRVLGPGGRLVIADFGLQRTRAMRLGFRAIVQLADGVADTQPNADGAIPGLISEAGFAEVREADAVRTVAGSISIYTAVRG